MNNAAIIAQTMNNAGFDVLPMEMDLSSRSSILSLIDSAEAWRNLNVSKCRRSICKKSYVFAEKHVRLFKKTRTCFSKMIIVFLKC